MDPQKVKEAIKAALGSRQMSELTPDELKALAQQVVPQWAGKDPVFLRQQFAMALGNDQAASNIAQATPQQVTPTAGNRPADPTMPDLSPTESDRRLVEQTIGASGDIARRQLEATLPTIMDRVTARAGAQGIVGGSGEVASRALAGAEATRSFADMLSGQQAQGAQALMQLPFQRAGMNMDFNNSLWNRYIQSATLDFQKQSHVDDMALQREQMRYQQQQQRNSALGGLLGLVGRGVGAYATGGMSEVYKNLAGGGKP